MMYIKMFGGRRKGDTKMKYLLIWTMLGLVATTSVRAEGLTATVTHTNGTETVVNNFLVAYRPRGWTEEWERKTDKLSFSAMLSETNQHRQQVSVPLLQVSEITFDIRWESNRWHDANSAITLWDRSKIEVIWQDVHDHVFRRTTPDGKASDTHWWYHDIADSDVTGQLVTDGGVALQGGIVKGRRDLRGFVGFEAGSGKPFFIEYLKTRRIRFNNAPNKVEK